MSPSIEEAVATFKALRAGSARPSPVLPAAPSPIPLEEAIVLEPRPCDLCNQIATCSKAAVACEAFRAYVAYGGSDSSRWNEAPRCPSAEIYARTYRIRPEDLAA